MGRQTRKDWKTIGIGGLVGAHFHAGFEKNFYVRFNI